MSKKLEYYHASDGEWIRVTKRNHREQCCDCGLVHRVNYRIVEGTIEIQTFRDPRATGGARRNQKPIS